MNTLIERYNKKKKENEIDEISDIFEYGQLENDVCVELCQLLINDVIKVEDKELQESMLNAISNAAIYKDVGEYINIDILVDNIDKFYINNLEYVFIVIGFSHNKKYIPKLKFYLDSKNENLSENAKLALRELKATPRRNKMYIKFDEFELLELFGNEPISIGDLEAGELIYSLSDNKGFKIVMFMSVYENVCEVSIDYQELNVFACRIEKVVSINKVNDEMIINNEEKSVLKVKFKNQIGVKLL